MITAKENIQSNTSASYRLIPIDTGQNIIQQIASAHWFIEAVNSLTSTSALKTKAPSADIEDTEGGGNNNEEYIVRYDQIFLSSDDKSQENDESNDGPQIKRVKM